MRLSLGAFAFVLFWFDVDALIVICCLLYFQIFRFEPVGDMLPVEKGDFAKIVLFFENLQFGILYTESPIVFRRI